MHREAEQQLRPDGAARDHVAWTRNAIAAIHEDDRRVAPTSLLPLKLVGLPLVRILVKDERSLPTASLKYRVARALFLRGLCNGDIGPDTHVVEASSGSAAIAEAYFAKAVGVQFTAVIPRSTAAAKVKAIQVYGGNIHFTEPGEDLAGAASNLAGQPGHLFLDQFTYAEQATCWRGPSNVAAEIMAQLEQDDGPPLAWIVVGAGTGGTSSSIGRYLRFHGMWGPARLCVADPEGSIFFRQFATGDCRPGGHNSDFIEGIGRKRVSPSFLPQLVDHMIEVPDAASIGAAHWLTRSHNLKFGPSTGTNLIGALTLGSALQAEGRPGTVLLLGCDDGERYADTIYDQEWLRDRSIDLLPWMARCAQVTGNGAFPVTNLRQCAALAAMALSDA